MLDEPLPHLLIGPRPRKGMSVEAVILRPGGYHMLEQLLPFAPGISLPIALAEGSDQQFRLVQPRGVGWREAGSPPIPAFRPVDGRVPRRVAGVTVLNQEHPFKAVSQNKLDVLLLTRSCKYCSL